MLFGETANKQQQIQNSPRAADELRVLAVRERDGDRLRGRYLGSGRPCSLHLSMYSSTSWSTRPARQQVRNLEAPKRQQTTAKVGEIPFKKIQDPNCNPDQHRNRMVHCLCDIPTFLKFHKNPSTCSSYP